MMKDFFRRHPNLKISILVITSVSLLLIAQTSLWLSNNVFNNQKFTQITTEAITSESSRQSISNLLVDRMLEDRPMLNSVLGNRISSLISGLLGTDLAERSIEKIVQNAQLILTTPKKPPIVIDVRPYKQAAINISNALMRDDEPKIDINRIPDEIVLLDTSKLPNYYQYGILLLWLGPIAALLALALLGAWIYRAKIAVVRLMRTRIALAAVLASGLIAMLIGPLFKPAFLSVAESAQAMTLLGNIYDGFIAPFYVQSQTISVIAFLLLVVTYAWAPINKAVRNAQRTT